MPSKLKTITRSDCRTIREAAEEALKKVAADFGLTVKLNPGSFSPSTFAFKAEFETVAEDGVPANFKTYARMFGLVPEDFGKTFTRFDGQTVKVIDIMPRRRKFPIYVENVSTGRKFLLTETEAARFLHPTPAVAA